MCTPRVSVVIPVYNGERYLEPALKSVLLSTYSDFEIVAVDDGSSDGSYRILEECAKENGKLKIHQFDRNRGMDVALNHAIGAISSAPLIARLNQDDEMLQDRLAQQVTFLDSNPDVVVVGGQMALMDENGRLFDEIRYPLDDAGLRNRWMKVSPFGDPCVMYRKDAWQRVGGYNQTFWPVDDLAMWFSLGRIGKLANVESVVTRMRWHSRGGSFRRYKRMVLRQFAVRRWAWRSLGLRVSTTDLAFWVAQLVSGLLLPAHWNWHVYRLIKRYL